MAVPPAPDERAGLTKDNSTHDSDLPDNKPSEPRAAVGARRFIAVVLGLSVIASAGVLVVLLTQRSGDTDGLQSQREKVMSQSRQFILNVNTYGPDLLADDGTMPDYRKRVEDLITSKFAADFEQTVPAAEATVQQAGFSRRAEVFGAGVSVIDSDSATALVAGSFTNSYPDPNDQAKRVDDLPLPFRVKIELVKVGGEWLVDSFAPVTGESDQPSETPTDSPSETPSDTPSATPSESVPSEQASP